MAGPFLRALGGAIRGLVSPPREAAAPTPQPTTAVPSATEVAAKKPAMPTMTIALIVGGAVVAVGILVFALKK